MKKQDSLNIDYSGTEELWSIENTLTNYSNGIVSSLSKMQPSEAAITLEFGAGIGTLAEIWKKRTGNAPDCVELDIKLQSILRARGFTTFTNLNDTSKLYDLIYTSNVLEHIEDDIGAIKQIHSKLNKDGILGIYVPALMILYSRFDAKVGHIRRYEKSELKKKIKSAGFEVLTCEYSDMIGFFAWLAKKHSKNTRDTGLGGNQKLAFYDKYLYPLSNFLDKAGFKHLFGKNLLLIARKVS
jgi:SAM-dependent methyltransferase